eukprot:scaffold3768_cov154-Pinguiococcus_pyrenoidosus.AAC.1
MDASAQVAIQVLDDQISDIQKQILDGNEDASLSIQLGALEVAKLKIRKKLASSTASLASEGPIHRSVDGTEYAIEQAIIEVSPSQPSPSPSEDTIAGLSNRFSVFEDDNEESEDDKISMAESRSFTDGPEPRTNNGRARGHLEHPELLPEQAVIPTKSLQASKRGDQGRIHRRDKPTSIRRLTSTELLKPESWKFHFLGCCEEAGLTRDYELIQKFQGALSDVSLVWAQALCMDRWQRMRK